MVTMVTTMAVVMVMETVVVMAKVVVMATVVVMAAVVIMATVTETVDTVMMVVTIMVDMEDMALMKVAPMTQTPGAEVVLGLVHIPGQAVLLPRAAALVAQVLVQVLAEVQVLTADPVTARGQVEALVLTAALGPVLALATASVLEVGLVAVQDLADHQNQVTTRDLDLDQTSPAVTL